MLTLENPITRSAFTAPEFTRSALGGSITYKIESYMGRVVTNKEGVMSLPKESFLQLLKEPESIRTELRKLIFDRIRAHNELIDY